MERQMELGTDIFGIVLEQFRKRPFYRTGSSNKINNCFS